MLDLGVEFKLPWGAIKFIAGDRFRVKFNEWSFGLDLNTGESGVCLSYNLELGLGI